MSVEKQQKTFKDIQDEYNALYAVKPVRDEDRAYRWLAEQLFHCKPDIKTILDVACGGGYFLREISRHGNGMASLHGIDISQTALDLARKECPTAQYAVAVAEELPFESKTFDAITCLGSLEHFLDVEKSVTEMKRVTRQDGILFILVPNIFWYKDIWSVLWTGDRKTRNQTHERFASLMEWKDMLKSLGLNVVKTQKYNGIAKRPAKQWLKDLLIPLRFSYHFLFICKKQ